MGRLLQFGRSERGASLPEVMVAMVLMVAIVPILGPLMTSSMRTTTAVEHQSRVLTELRLQVQTIARELRSAECIYQPGHNQTGSVIRFTTNASFAAGDETYEALYEIVDGRLMRSTRSLPVADPAVWDDSRVVGEGLIEPEASFSQISNPRLSVGIRLLVQFEDDDAPKEIRTVLAGRNAWRSC